MSSIVLLLLQNLRITFLSVSWQKLLFKSALIGYQCKILKYTKSNCCLFERLLKIKKNGGFLFGISSFILILSLITFLCLWMSLKIKILWDSSVINNISQCILISLYYILLHDQEDQWLKSTNQIAPLLVQYSLSIGLDTIPNDPTKITLE